MKAFRSLWFRLALVLAAALLPLAAIAQSVADPAAVWAALSQPAFDPQKVATVNDLALERDLARLTLTEGALGFAQPVNSRVLMAAFRGKGVLRLAPTLPL